MVTVIVVSSALCSAPGAAPWVDPQPSRPVEEMDSVVQRVEAPRARPEEPSSGLGQLITGAIMTGVGAVNLATSPVCVADFYVRDNGSGASNVCLYSTLIFGGVVAGVGLPLLIVGVNKRSEHQAWEREWGDLAVLPTPGGVALAWGIRL